MHRPVEGAILRKSCEEGRVRRGQGKAWSTSLEPGFVPAKGQCVHSKLEWQPQTQGTRWALTSGPDPQGQGGGSGE